MKILLVNPSFNLEKALGRFRRIYNVMPAINLAYLAAVLEKYGNDVEIIDDAAVQIGPNGILDVIKSKKPDLIGISCLTQTAPDVFSLAKKIKEYDKTIPLILGNLHASLFAQEILKNRIADIIVHSEGEYTLLELVNALGNGKDLKDVKGISFLAEDRVVHTPPRPFIENLDELPFPAWHLFPLKKYRLFSFDEIKTPAMIISGSRGCPYRCTFCSLLIMGNRRRKRSPKNIADEFFYLSNNLGYKQISFVDPIFPMRKGEGLEFCQEVTSRGLHKRIVWTTETRVDLVDRELLERMKEAGCRRIMYGFESGASSTLESLQKGFSQEDAVRTMKITRDVGIETIGFFMLGAPGETLKTIRKTINFAKELNIDFAKFTILVPYPGTKIYNDLISEGKLKTAEWHRFTSYPSKGTEPIYTPEGMTSKDLISLQRKATFEFYVRLKMIFRHLFQIRTVKIRDLLYGLASLFS